MRGNRNTDTAPEVALRSALHRSGLRFRKHVRPLSSLRCTADAVFPRERVAVFSDGCWWHRCPVHSTIPKANGDWWSQKLDRNFKRDRRNDAALELAGWAVVRVWEHEDPVEAAARIAALVEQRRLGEAS
jgi:DNA mismatch endonuclease (patch repair protein)